MIFYIFLLVGLYVLLGVVVKCLSVYFQVVDSEYPTYEYINNILYKYVFEPQKVIVASICVSCIKCISFLYVIFERVVIDRNGEEVATISSSGGIYNEITLGAGEYTVYKYNEEFVLYPETLNYDGERKKTHYIPERGTINNVYNKKARNVTTDDMNEIINSPFNEVEDIVKPEELSSIII